MRAVAFLGIFVIISGIIGPKIISGGILFRDGFAVYGGLGKAAIFGLVAFVLLVRHKGLIVKLQPWQPGLLTWLGTAILLAIVAWGGVDELIANERTATNLVLAHAGIILSIVCAMLACFGRTNATLLWNAYKKELLLASAIAGLFFVFLLGVYALWQPLASVVIVCVSVLLEVSGITTALILPNTLITDKFGITVAEFCSGIESIALFSGLYVVVGLLDRELLNVRRYLLVFPLALALLFGLNIVRVYLLITAGYYINADIAFSLFHSYAGMVFFILYSAAFWMVAYKYLFNKPQKKNRRGKDNN